MTTDENLPLSSPTTSRVSELSSGKSLSAHQGGGSLVIMGCHVLLVDCRAFVVSTRLDYQEVEVLSGHQLFLMRKFEEEDAETHLRLRSSSGLRFGGLSGSELLLLYKRAKGKLHSEVLIAFSLSLSCF